MSAKTLDISIWFFIGALLACYGILILGAGVWVMLNPPAKPTVLHELHPALWWGALLLALGGGYSYKFRPKKRK
mgnify:CR=1 FL=1